MYDVFKVPTFRFNLQPSSGESEKLIRKRHVTYAQIQPITGSCTEARPQGQRWKIWRLSRKCGAEALCSNRSNNRKDLISHSFPKDQILRKTWEIRMKCGDKLKFASNTALCCYSEQFRALCGDGVQKEFDKCKARSCKKCHSFHFYMVRS